MVANDVKRVVFLCSGGGGNLAFVHQAIIRGWLPEAQIVEVLTDRLCQANDFAERVGLPNRCIDFKDEGQRNLLTILDELKPDLIITTVHKILGETVVEHYRNRLINLHYSLLPAFAGLIGARSVQAALDYGTRFSGVTVHRVDESVDGGRPLVQGVIALQGEETLDELMNVVFRSGGIALLSAITHLLDGTAKSHAPSLLNILGRTCLFNGGSPVTDELVENEDFWQQLRQALDVTN